MYAPTGPFRRTVARNQTFMRSSGWRGSLTPDGGCREATWRSIQRGLRLLPADPVRVFAFLDGVRTAIFWGELRQGGNLQDAVGEDCVLRGFHVRFREASLPQKSYPKMDAGTLVYTAFQDCIAAGEFGTPPLISVAPADFPPLNFQLDVQNTYGQPLSKLIERVFEQSNQADLLECMVRPDGSAYLKVKKANDLSNVLVLPDLIKPDWQPPVQEVICTRVLWLLEERLDGKGWLSHPSDHPDLARYGPRAQPVPVEAEVKPLVFSPFDATINSGSGDVAITAQERLAILGQEDGQMLAAVATADNADVIFRQVLPQGAAKYHLEVLWSGGLPSADQIVIQPGDGAPARTIQPRFNPFSGFLGTMYAQTLRVTRTIPTIYRTYGLPPGTVITVTGKSDPAAAEADRRVSVRIVQAAPESPNAPLLDSMAKGYWQVPVREPGRLTHPGLLRPADLKGHVRVGSYFRPVHAWEYTIEGGPRGGVNTHALTEQADDPRALALQQLIKYRDQQATMRALTARK